MQQKPIEGPIKLAMLGMVEGNGHPYSWSAIINGFDHDAMAACPYPVIPQYLGREPAENVGMAGVKVTHIWTDDPDDAKKVAAAALIPNIVTMPTDVIGEVDAVLIATDIGSEHVARCSPFMEAGIPIFVDKPLIDNEADLRTFLSWVEQGAPILSSSCMRYAREFSELRNSTEALGELRYASITTPKSWERYGIHALEAVYPILGPGFVSARNSGEAGRDIVHFKHQGGADVNVAAISDMYGGFGVLQLCGTKGYRQEKFDDTFYAFKAQLEAFVGFLRTGERPFLFEETAELMRMVVAGIISREQGGREVRLDEIA